MQPTATLILALGLAADAFAVSVASGLKIKYVKVSKALKIAIFFGGWIVANWNYYNHPQPKPEWAKEELKRITLVRSQRETTEQRAKLDARLAELKARAKKSKDVKTKDENKA